MAGLHRKDKARDTFELFADVKRKGRTWTVTCKMAHCSWSDTAGNEILVSKKWIQHFDRVHVAKWDGRNLPSVIIFNLASPRREELLLVPSPEVTTD